MSSTQVCFPSYPLDNAKTNLMFYDEDTVDNEKGFLTPQSDSDKTVCSIEDDNFGIESEGLEFAKGIQPCLLVSSVSTADSLSLSKCSSTSSRNQSLEHMSKLVLERSQSQPLTIKDNCDDINREGQGLTIEDLKLEKRTSDPLLGQKDIQNDIQMPDNTKEEQHLRTSKSSSSLDMGYQHIFPKFDSEEAYSEHYNFENQNRTVVHHNNIHFASVPADQPLPSSGKYKFSVQIEHCRKEHPKLYIGICTGNHRGSDLRYHPGYYFLSAFSSHSHLNGLKNVQEHLLPRKGQTVSVSIDLDNKYICFDVDGDKILDGRLSLPRDKTKKFYPFVCIGEPQGRVSFV